MCCVDVDHYDCMQVSLHQGIPIGGQFMRTSSIELGDIYRTASAISVLLEEADARPFINRLMSMPAMNADGIATRQVIDASTINPNIEVSLVCHLGHLPFGGMPDCN